MDPRAWPWNCGCATNGDAARWIPIESASEEAVLLKGCGADPPTVFTPVTPFTPLTPFIPLTPFPTEWPFANDMPWNWLFMEFKGS